MPIHSLTTNVSPLQNDILAQTPHRSRCTCVAEAVVIATGQHVRIRAAPQVEHGVVDLPP